MKDIEDPFIIKLQDGLSPSCRTGFCNFVLSIPARLYSPYLAGFWMLVWYLCADSLLAFKGSIVLAIGVYLMAMLNLIYKDGRPFWNNVDI